MSFRTMVPLEVLFCEAGIRGSAHITLVHQNLLVFYLLVTPEVAVGRENIIINFCIESKSNMEI